MKLDEVLREIGYDKHDNVPRNYDVMVQKEDKIYMVDDVIVKHENNTIYLIVD